LTIHVFHLLKAHLLFPSLLYSKAVSPLRFATAIQIRHRYAMSIGNIVSPTERVKPFWSAPAERSGDGAFDGIRQV
jgi:hypothetical protein